MIDESNRNIICSSPLRENQNWLYDLVIDREIYETKKQQIPVHVQNQLTVLNCITEQSGTATTAYGQALKILRLIINDDEGIRFGIGPRHNRQLSVIRGNDVVVPNIFQMSSGQTCLLNLFISILRDFDLTNKEMTNLEDIEGIVIIDEIEMHLHSFHQHNILPELIKLFPRIQFIIATHSPLFLMGMEKVLGSDGIEIIEMPTGEPITTEKFSEFEDAYLSFQQTGKYKSDLEEAIFQSKRPTLVVEGDYDVRYLRRAAELLGREDIFEKVDIKDGGGFGGLDKIWKIMDKKPSEFLQQKMILLYDCDMSKAEDSRGNVVKGCMQTIENNPIKKGVENLFGKGLLDRAISQKADLIDVYEA